MGAFPGILVRQVRECLGLSGAGNIHAFKTSPTPGMQVV